MIHTGLKVLPEALGDLENLNILNLADNDLSNLPESIFKLKNLKELILSGNTQLNTKISAPTGTGAQ